MRQNVKPNIKILHKLFQIHKNQNMYEVCIRRLDKKCTNEIVKKQL